MKYLVAALVLLPSIAMAQPAPTLQSQLDAATVQAQRVLIMLNGQVTADQALLEAKDKQIADLQKQLAAKAPVEPKKD